MNQRADIANLIRDVPVIDLAPVIAGAPGAQQRAAEQLLAACERLAFFFVANHGVPVSVMDDLIAESARFHAMPMEEKLKVKVGADILGYLPPGGQTQRTSIYNNNTRRELSASFYCRREAAPGETDADKPWFHRNRWPENLPGFREKLLNFAKRSIGIRKVPGPKVRKVY